MFIHNNYIKITPPNLHPSLQRTSCLTILGVSFAETLNITPHIDNIITKCYQTFHAIEIMRAHGLFGLKLCDIIESHIVSCMKYTALSRCGFANHEHIKQLQSLLNKLIGLNYLPPNDPKIKPIFASLDEHLFSIRSSQLSSLHPVICEDERTITPKPIYSCYQDISHSFLVFSILNKLIILIAHRF